MMMQRFLSTRSLAFFAFGLAAILWAWHRLNPLKFSPINGDFQTFNPVARLIDGQIPFVDFANYLGMGPLLLTTIAALPGGVTFAASVAGTDILVSLAFLYMATMAFRLLGTPKPWLFAILLYLAGRLPLYMELLPDSDEISHATTVAATLSKIIGLKSMVSPGHSLMPLRVLWPFIAAVPLILFLRAPSVYRAVILGVTLGAGVFWSTDYGPTTALVFGVFLVLWKPCLRHILVGIGSMVAASLLTVFIITGGHPDVWLMFSRSVAADQFWYYYFPGQKVFSLDSIPLDATTWLLLLALLAGGSAIFRAFHEPTPEKRTFAAIFATTLLASTLSLFGSAWFIYYLSAPIFLAVVMAISHYAPALDSRINLEGFTVRLSLALLAALFAALIAIHPRHPPTEPGERQLGAALRADYEGFESLLAKARQHSDSVWSTYATATESALQMFQKTGQDYIIHALGDNGRTRYLDGFREMNPQLVITPSPKKNIWEIWSRTMNWWFYRELVLSHKTDEHHAYWSTWIPDALAEAPKPIRCKLKSINPSAVEIVVDGGQDSAGWVADMKLIYVTKAPLLSRKVLEIESTFLDASLIAASNKTKLDKSGIVSVGLPPDAPFWHVPMHLDHTGTGSARIHLNLRSSGAALDIHSCEATRWAPMERMTK